MSNMRRGSNESWSEGVVCNGARMAGELDENSGGKSVRESGVNLTRRYRPANSGGCMSTVRGFVFTVLITRSMFGSSAFL